MITGQKRFRYDTSGDWYKGNTHVHSTASDGGKTYAEIAELYSTEGYDFLFATDHGVPSDVAKIEARSGLLWLNGIEINGQDEDDSSYHVVCLGKVSGINPETPFSDAVHIARDCDALMILAHPFWMDNTLDETSKWDFDGVEIYNHVCHWLNGKSSGLVYWNTMLKQNPDTLAFSADDAHLRPEHPGWNGGWIVVNTKEYSRMSFMEAIRRGNYYSSCGPEFHTIDVKVNKVFITTSPVQFVRLVGPANLGQRMGSFCGQQGITEASFSLPYDWDYMYIEIEDQKGKRAWTNTLFTG